MRKLFLFAASALLFTACNNAAKVPDANKTDTVATTPVKSVDSKPIARKIIDPVCGMEKDSTWTDFTLYNGDTLWFCASAEKDAFIANPKKYIKQ